MEVLKNVLGPLNRSDRHDQSLDLVTTNPDACNLHELCHCCRKVTSKSKLLRDTSFWKKPCVESYTLHSALSSLARSVKQRCHLCTLIWEGIHSAKGPLDGDSKAETANGPLRAKLNDRLNRSSPSTSKQQRLGPIKVTVSLLPGSAVPYIEVFFGGKTGGNDQRKLVMPVATYDESKRLLYAFSVQRYNNTSSPEHMKLVKYWIKECTTKHLHCGTIKTGFVPTRLVRIEGAEPHPVLRIYHTSPSDRNSDYLTLSHCWGNAQDILKLTMKCILEYEVDLRFKSLPRTFQDAVRITLGLGLKYLWIDSLCIIQDSKEDWARESATMASIYENSLCTIAAAGATNAHGGCFATRDPLQTFYCKVGGNSKDGVYIGPSSGSESAAAILTDSPLVSRAWVLQERLLSARMIHFGARSLYWTCLQGFASDAYMIGSGDITPGHTQPIFGDETAALDWKAAQLPIGGHSFFESLVNTKFEPSSKKSILKFNSNWWRLIEIYTRCKLTMASDKLVAMSGVVQRIQQSTGLKYLAGVWSEILPLNFCWFVRLGVKPPPTVYRAPSWSWAARDGEIFSWDALTDNLVVLANVVSANVTTDPRDPSGTGAVSAACLVVLGSLREVGCPKFHRAGKQSDETEHRLFDGETKLGQCHLDSSLLTDEVRRVYLLPLLLSLPPDYQGNNVSGQSEPQWKEICGLLVSPSSQSINDSSTFQRIGFFNFYCTKSDFSAIEWLDGIQRRNIVIE